jgi:hypothetical protein
MKSIIYCTFLCCLLSYCSNAGPEFKDYNIFESGDTLIIQPLVENAEQQKRGIRISDDEITIFDVVGDQNYGPSYTYNKDHQLIKYSFNVANELVFSCRYLDKGVAYLDSGSPLTHYNFTIQDSGLRYVEFRDYLAPVPNLDVRICRYINDSLYHCERLKMKDLDFPHRDTLFFTSRDNEIVKSVFTFFPDGESIELLIDGYALYPDED